MSIVFYLAAQQPPESEVRALRLTSGDPDQVSGWITVDDPEIRREAAALLDSRDDIYVGTWDDFRREWSTWELEAGPPGPLQRRITIPR